MAISRPRCQNRYLSPRRRLIELRPLKYADAFRTGIERHVPEPELDIHKIDTVLPYHVRRRNTERSSDASCFIPCLEPGRKVVKPNRVRLANRTYITLCFRMVHHDQQSLGHSSRMVVSEDWPEIPRRLESELLKALLQDLAARQQPGWCIEFVLVENAARVARWDSCPAWIPARWNAILIGPQEVVN